MLSTTGVDTALTSVELPVFTPATVFTAANLDQWMAIALVVVAGLYLYGVHKLRARGDRWPIGRTLAFVPGGLGVIALATLSGVGTYDDTLFSAHMVQHMMLSMVAPILMALGAPVTLALRTLPARSRKALLAFLHSRYFRLISHPLIAFVFFIATPYALYLSGWYPATLTNTLLHEFTHVHFLVVGSLFFWPLIGLDPLPGRWPYPARALMMIISMPLHAVLGVIIMQMAGRIATSYYEGLNLSWVSPAMDQQVGGGLLWASGDLISLLMLAAFVTQWIRSDERTAARIDRQLDRTSGEDNALDAYNARLARLAERRP
ncbi:cytochrome c oxidase assembly protein [Cryptosporangium aurantiacum]|uniref:Putative copper resistance protein D n=1 Tax=Cryptosporangium aurantiacum TaxID=134849 RepID=A0A1M7R7P1_9ACTN|nr:cytochrome c oxidase assembly protein [Cryptosporangium aurantiacum]SHN42283.1 putative copper resistance protein D [Cryptosporangium aurantiacum]